ncbi:MAG: SRPBCC domain-containing protein [Bacteroidetes bacterium]|nr:SRPBCC domain-containing protein [Bacteroidota bacterium]
MDTTTNKTTITIEVTVDADIQNIWALWTLPEYITRWNYASPDWHAPRAENDLREGGKFSSRMEAKDGSAGFDFSGVYHKIIKDELISYTMDDGRKAQILFETVEHGIRITTTFEAENENPVELQKEGWQAILNNFKTFAEAHKHSNLSRAINKNDHK